MIIIILFQVIFLFFWEEIKRCIVYHSVCHFSPQFTNSFTSVLPSPLLYKPPFKLSTSFPLNFCLPLVATHTARVSFLPLSSFFSPPLLLLLFWHHQYHHTPFNFFYQIAFIICLYVSPLMQ